MTVDEYLNRCRQLRKRVEKLQDKYNELQSAATTPGSAFYSDVSPARDTRGREKLLATMIDASQDLKAAQIEYLECRHDLFFTLLKLRPFDEAEALILRYVEELPIDKFCEEWSGNERSRRHFFRCLRSGKENLRQFLIDQGIEIE